MIITNCDETLVPLSWHIWKDEAAAMSYSLSLWSSGVWFRNRCHLWRKSSGHWVNNPDPLKRLKLCWMLAWQVGIEPVCLSLFSYRDCIESPLHPACRGPMLCVLALRLKIKNLKSINKWKTRMVLSHSWGRGFSAFKPKKKLEQHRIYKT